MIVDKKNALYNDVQSVVKNSKKLYIYRYESIIHTEKKDINVIKLISKDTVRDYINHTSDFTVVELLIGKGDYVYDIYPNRHNLEISVKKISITGTNNNTSYYVERFKAIFLDEENEKVATKFSSSRKAEDLNIKEIYNVKFQLVNRSLEPLTIKTFSGVYNFINMKDLLHSVLINESNKILVDGKPSIDSVDIVEPSNKQVIKQIVIKSGTYVINFPTYLQEESLGVYNAGLGHYFQSINTIKTWFVYSLFDTTRFKTSKKKIIFYVVPTLRETALEYSYSVEGDIVKALVTSNNNYLDNVNSNQINNGSGFKLSNASAFMKKPVEISEKGVLADRGRLNYEVINKQRDDGLNHAKMSNVRISDNPFKEFSKYNSERVSAISLVWENADSELVYPGMPCKFVFATANNTIIELNGVVVFAHHFYGVAGKGVFNTPYTTRFNIIIMCETIQDVLDRNNKNTRT